MTSRPLRIGIIGCGNVAARLHVPVWLENAGAVEVVGIVDPATAARGRIAEMVGVGRENAHADVADLLSRDDVDAVDICTPPRGRHEVIMAAARAGKHVLCEKPIATVPADAAAAVDAAAGSGVTLAMVHNFLWLPEVLAARQVIDSGEIGDVRSVIVNFLGVVYVPGAAGDWRKDPVEAGGGIAIDIVHGIYLAESLLGERLERVSAYIDAAAPTSRVEDTALCRFETATKVCLVNFSWGFGAGGVEVAGSAGRVSIRYRGGATAPWAPLEAVTVTTDGGSRTVLGPEGPRLAVHDEFPSMYASFQGLARDFAQAVSTGRRPRASGADGLRALEATHAAYESAVTGRTVAIPLDRSGPVFLRGVLGLRSLDAPDWSPIRHGALFEPVADRALGGGPAG